VVSYKRVLSRYLNVTYEESKNVENKTLKATQVIKLRIYKMEVRVQLSGILHLKIKIKMAVQAVKFFSLRIHWLGMTVELSRSEQIKVEMKEKKYRR